MSPSYQRTACEAPRSPPFPHLFFPPQLSRFLLDGALWHNVPLGEAGVLHAMRFAFGEYQLDTEARTLRRNGTEGSRPEPKVFDLLVYLIEHRERVVSANELLDTFWPWRKRHTGGTLRGLWRRPVRAVGDDGVHQMVLRTEHGRGFRFVADVYVVPAPEAAPPASSSFRTWWITAAGVVAFLLAVTSFWLLDRQAPEALAGHSLAVLPFVNMSADPEQEYFADGIAEELLNTFAHFEGLRVVGRTSSFSFKDSDADLRTIGEALGADVILEGSVRIAGHRVRITAQLVDAEDGYHRWSDTYERELDDIFAIQTEIATAIADALRVRLSSEERDRLATRPTQNLHAYQAYLLGMQRLMKETAWAFVEAIDYFEQAIALDPGFALAYVGLASSYLYQMVHSGLPPGELLAKAQVAVDKALELDDQLAETHTILAVTKWYSGDYEGAEPAYQRALELGPNSASTHFEFGCFLADEPQARYEEALAHHKRAFELDPLLVPAISWIGFDLFTLGRFDESLVWFEKALEIDPGHGNTYSYIADYHSRVSGRLDEAVAWDMRSLAADPENVMFLSYLGRHLLDLGDPDSAEPRIERAIELGSENYLPILALEYLHLYKGDEAAAFEAGRRAYAMWPLEEYTLPLILMRDHEVRVGRYTEARALYEKHYPELLNEREPEVDRGNYRAAIDLALILSSTGEQERADLLLKRSLQQIQRMTASWRQWVRVRWMSRFTRFAERSRRHYRAFAMPSTRAGVWGGGTSSSSSPIWSPCTTNPSSRRWSPRSKPTWPHSSRICGRWKQTGRLRRFPEAKRAFTEPGFGFKPIQRSAVTLGSLCTNETHPAATGRSQTVS